MKRFSINSPAHKVTAQGVPPTDRLRGRHLSFNLPSPEGDGRPAAQSRDFNRRAVSSRMGLSLLLAFISIPLCAQTAVPSTQEAVAWHYPLYLDGGGYWARRVPLTITSEQALDGKPVTITLGAGPQQVNLIGADARAVRVVDEDGNELLYNLSGPDSASLRQGALKAGDSLMVPVVCAAHSQQKLWVYFDNDKAGQVPDYLQSAAFANGGFESGAGEPAAWIKQGEDAEHKLILVSVGAHSGQRCVMATVTAGAAASWCKYAQTGLPIVAGHDYELRAWVKAENVVGSAGWYIHVDGAQPLLINQVLNGGAGSYGWKELTFRFTAPATGTMADVGTALYGTGRAWYDDCALTDLTAANIPSAIAVSVGAVASMPLREVPAQVAWSQKVAVRVPLRLYNFQNTPQSKALIATDMRRSLIVSRLTPAPHVRVYEAATGREVPTRLEAQKLSFQADIAPRTSALFYAYLVPQSSGSIGPELSQDALFIGPRNRIQNPDFAAGDVALPTAWTLSAQTPDKSVASTAPQVTGRRVAGGKVGTSSLELNIPQGVEPAWAGWHQMVPVEPNGTYFVGAWLKTKDVDGTVTVNLHIRNTDKQLVTVNPMSGASPALSGTTDWTWVQTTISIPADARFIELHLTSNAHGTIWYNGVVLRRLADALPAQVLPLETPVKPGLAVWQVNPMVKVFRDDPVGSEVGTVAARLAGNERASLQLVLKSDKALPGLQVRVGPLRNAAGQTLPPVTVARVGYVPVDWPTNYYRISVPAWQRKIPTATPSSDGWPGDWPDPLAPGGAVNLAAGQTQPMCLTLYAPANATPGTYRGQVTISGPGIQRAIPLQVTVRNFALPKRPSLQISYDLRGATGKERDAWYRFMAEHRAGPSYLPNPDIKLENGEVKMDFTEFDRAATYAFNELGISAMYAPDYFYALGWAYSPHKFLGIEAFTPEWEKAFGSAYRQYIDHVRQQGWLDRIVFYLSDEPFGTRQDVADNLQKFSKFEQSIAPEVPVYSSTWTYMDKLKGAVTRWGAGHFGGFPLERIAERKAAGDTFWFTTDGQQCLDTPYAGTERLLSWYCAKYGIMGFEFWGVNWYTYDPWQYGWHNFIQQSDSEKDASYWIRYPNGDGYLAYPGQDVGVAGPVSSIRLEAIRDGEEDYEYLTLLQQRIAAAKQAGKSTTAASAVLAHALSLVTIPNPGGLRTSETVPNPDAFLAARNAVADQIEALR